MTELQTRATPATAEPCLADDLLRGADEIAEFIYKDKRQRRKIYHLAETSKFPVFRLGGMLCGRKSRILKHIEQQEAEAMKPKMPKDNSND
jgi:hypothetical protein